MVDRLKVLKYYLYYKYRRPFSDRQALERWQKKKLKKHMEYVAEHSELYRGMRSLEEYPVADKSFMMEHFDALNTVGIKREDAEAFAVRAERDRNFVPKLQGVTVGLSSGTSGRRGIFLVSDEEKVRWAGYILAKFLPGSILGSYDIAFFMRADSNLYQAVSSKNIRFHFFDIYRDMDEHKKRLEAQKPDILVGQPSLLLMLAAEMERGKLHISPQIVISIAEVLEREDEVYLKKVFRQEMIHQVYQCTEGCLAATCSHGTLHLNEDIVRIEREYLDTCRFIPIVTDFERKAQPVIRCRLNDILVERKAPCGCSSPFLALEKIEGREDDMFSFLDEQGKEKMIFPDFIRRCVLFAAGDEPVEEHGIRTPEDSTAEENGIRTPEDSTAEENGIRTPEDSTAEENGIRTLEDSAAEEHGKYSPEHRTMEYRIVQKPDRSIMVYADFGDEERARVRREFEKLAGDRKLVLPKITFAPYYRETGKKLKRVACERKRGQEKGE